MVEKVHKLMWMILAVLLFIFATYGFMNVVYWVIIGHDVEYGIGFIAGTFAVLCSSTTQLIGRGKK